MTRHAHAVHDKSVHLKLLNEWSGDLSRAICTMTFVRICPALGSCQWPQVHNPMHYLWHISEAHSPHKCHRFPQYSSTHKISALPFL